MTEDRGSEDDDWWHSWQEIFEITNADIDARRKATHEIIQNAEDPELIKDIAEESSARLKQMREIRNHSEQIWSKYFLVASQLSAIFLFAISGDFGFEFANSSPFVLAFTVVGALFIVLAFRAAVGIARWALFDILRLRDGLGR